MTAIEWCQNEDGTKGKSWNPIRARNLKTGRIGHHCEHVNEACRFCYAERLNLNTRNLPYGGTGLPFKPGHLKDVEIFLDADKLLEPLTWRKPQRVFVDSMDDPFGRWVKSEWLDKIFAVMALCPQHTFIVLTKRPGAAREYLQSDEHVSAVFFELQTGIGRLSQSPGSAARLNWPLSNVWLLVSCAEQKDVNEFVPILLQTPAAKRGVSLEPLIAPVDLTAVCYRDEDAEIRINALTAEAWVDNSDSASAYTDENDGNTKLDWVIVGGESGPEGVRAMHPAWPRKARDDCKAAGVPFFFKQWGTLVASDDGRTARLSKAMAGRLLDGVEHNEWPRAAEPDLFA